MIEVGQPLAKELWSRNVDVYVVFPDINETDPVFAALGEIEDSRNRFFVYECDVDHLPLIAIARELRA